MDLSGKTIIVTGATGGIGKALVKKLAADKPHLILIARSASKLKALTKTLQGVTLKGDTYVSDLTDSAARRRLAKTLVRKYPTVDILINTAGIGVYKPIGAVTEKDWNTSFALNVATPYFLTQALIPSLKNSSLSLVLNLGSGAGVIPMRGRSVYCSTKFALRGATLSLAEEYNDQKPHFCLITLGSTLTSFGPMTLAEKQRDCDSGKAYFTPEWVAKKLVEIIKDDHRETEYTLYPGDYGFGEWKKP